MQSFVDTEGAHGLSTELIKTPGITFRMYEPGYFLDFHTAPRGNTASADGRDRGGDAGRDDQALRAGNSAPGGGPYGHRALDARGGNGAAVRHHHSSLRLDA